MSDGGGIQEGFLLFLDFFDETVGQIQYVALEEGMLKVYSSADRLDAHFVEQIELTRHQVDVYTVPFEQGNGIPCRFCLQLSPYTSDGEPKKHLLFAAPSTADEHAWMKALINWQRHSFDISLRSLPLQESDRAKIDKKRASDLKALRGRMEQYDLSPRPPKASSPSKSSFWSWIQQAFA
ncbi:hypothetical protein LEN26_020565 [Aphanomyces euteiches]|nr:hypothetical protein LEN26_020565 [Aphanomyces euteiches]KAH9115253.1 hypothetical protein AeMF1_010691 [Aphanomyces euteiches]